MDLDPPPESDLPILDAANRAAPLIERAPLPMIEVEGQDHIVCFVNPAFCQLLQKLRGELLGKPFADIVANGAKCVPLLNRIYETGEFESFTEPDNTETTPAYWVCAMWPALGPDGRPVRVIIQLTKISHSLHNATAVNEALLISGLHQHELRMAAEALNARLQLEITERQRAEVALLQAQAHLRADADQLEQTVAQRTVQLRESVGELEAFSYSLVHDLRAPVRAIQGFGQIALEMSPDEVGPMAAELLRRVVKAASRMDSLIQDVLSLSQVIQRPMKIEPVDVDALVRDLVEERPELSLPRARIEIQGPLLSMLGHEASLSQCLTNLLNNAVKFVVPGVVPHVRVWTEESGPRIGLDGGVSSPASISRSRSLVRLWIQDNGIGIDTESHGSIFEIFRRLHHTAQYEGSGIGLAIVRKAIERMGGRVGVESERGKGSRFWLELPKA